MKITVCYEKHMSGKIVAKLEVVEADDYVTKNIFDDVGDLPSGWSRFGEVPAEFNFIILSSREDKILDEVLLQINAIKQHLKKWRNVTVPENTTFVI